MQICVCWIKNFFHEQTNAVRYRCKLILLLLSCSLLLLVLEWIAVYSPGETAWRTAALQQTCACLGAAPRWCNSILVTTNQTSRSAVTQVVGTS